MVGMAKWKIWTILALVAFGVIFAAPNLVPPERAEAIPSWLPHRQVSLGLDLLGGSYLLLQVDVDAVMKERLNNLIDGVRTAMRKERIIVSNLGPEGGTAVTFKVRDAGELEKARNAVRDIDPTTQVTTQPDGTVKIQFDQQQIADLNRKTLTQSVEIVRRRMDETGTKEPSIQTQGIDRILVQLPGLKDPERIKELLGKTAKLTFHLPDLTNSVEEAKAGHIPPGDELLPSDQAGADGKPLMYLIQRRVLVSGDRLTDAQPGTNPQSGQWVVNFTFDGVGTRQFADVTRDNVGRPFAVVLDGKVITAPVIREPILGGRGQISGNFTARSASDLAVLLRAGALPAPLKIIEERSIGPGLGADSIRAGVYSSIAGFVLVVAYMIAAYGLFGFFANVALVANLILIIAAMSILQATLTLPGIAGILLTLGMAVDANVLINERIREETKNGKTPLAALDAGFARALSTIVDANLTTLIKMLLLYIFGSGPVKGFAVTISIGILTSMVTATLLVRLLILLWIRYRRPKLLPV
ncbi:MAG: protein translocase subunit SecD [Alphaproteobacteria bacterium]|nr:protein translocase subunit SecD [Alphaproteobacteria bacterium]